MSRPGGNPSKGFGQAFPWLLLPPDMGQTPISRRSVSKSKLLFQWQWSLYQLYKLSRGTVAQRGSN